MLSPEKERQQLYWIWWEMRRRCRDPKSRDYVNYGGRGIVVCTSWIMSFEKFCADMGPRPNSGLLDRINNDGHYSPSNCKWSTRKEQNSNRRNCTYVGLDGETVTIKEACRRLGITYRPVMKRLNNGWKMWEALFIPIGKDARRARASRTAGL